MDKEQVLRIVEDMRLAHIIFLDTMVIENKMIKKVADQHKKRGLRLIKYLDKNLK